MAAKRSKKRWHRVLRSDELPRPGHGGDEAGDQGGGEAGEARPAAQQATTGPMVVPEIRPVEVGDKGALVTRLPTGEVVAFATHCPHEGTPLRHASLYEGNIRCPQHSYVYDPYTGGNVMPARDARPEALERLKPGSLTTYPVAEEEGWIWVNEEPNPSQPPTAGKAPGRPKASRSGGPTTDSETVGPPRTGAPAGGPGTSGLRRTGSPTIPSTPSGPTGAGDDLVDDQPRELSVATGEHVELALPTRVQPNHLWHFSVDGEAVAVQGQRFEERGAGATYLVDVVARQPGEAQVRCAYAKPWDAGARDVRTFTISVTDSG